MNEWKFVPPSKITASSRYSVIDSIIRLLVVYRSRICAFDWRRYVFDSTRSVSRSDRYTHKEKRQWKTRIMKLNLAILLLVVTSSYVTLAIFARTEAAEHWAHYMVITFILAIINITIQGNNGRR